MPSSFTLLNEDFRIVVAVVFCGATLAICVKNMIATSLLAGRYELQDPLGEGGMGIVYRALDTKTGSYVAIKTMRDVSDSYAVELFAKEWKVLAEMSHPNIVDVRDVDAIEENGKRRPFFVMPLLQGVTLGQLIETASPRLTVERVVEIICQVCRGLQAAHQRGLVHRDLKPSNIFVMEDDTAKIIDFGVVHLAGTQSVTGHKGTWQYMAPEQAELKPATPVSDIFSLGVVCYESLTLRKPFARKTAGETLEALLKYIPPSVSEINPNVNQLLSMVIHKALAKQAIHRFSSARDFSENLQKASHNQAIDRFDRTKIQPRIERARRTFAEGDYLFASEILTEIEAEGHIDSEITLLRGRIEEAVKQKRIKQLLESARARLEQDEVPLAIDKVREILELDPENCDAIAMRTAIEAQRNQRQIEGWLTLAQQHLDRHDFTEARRSAREVLAIRVTDKPAMELLREIDSREKEASRIRSQKEQLYGSALKAYNSGEISTALSKLERILSLAREIPDAAVPERDAVFQSFYNQVRSERDSVRNGFGEARRHLSDKNFTRTLEICTEFLNSYPNDALFQALKIETVEAERQELSAYIADVGRRVESEPDLDRRVNILKEACGRYPNEQQFAQSLKLVRERRDLVNSIVAKARQYEERSQFLEAMGQWDILRNIHPQYPGIEIEVEQLVHRREQQAREDERASKIEEIDHALDTGAHERAHQLALNALQEFPSDPEITGLERLAREGLERSEEVRRLLVEGDQACAQKKFVDALVPLRAAVALEQRNGAIRQSLINALVALGRECLPAEWHKAEPYVAEAAELESENAEVRSLRLAVNDARRKDMVAQTLSEVRDLQVAGKFEDALSKIEGTCTEYPNDARLEQYRNNIRNQQQEALRSEERKHDEAALKSYRKTLESKAANAETRNIIEQSLAIRRKYPDDPRIGSAFAQVEQIARTSDELTALLSATQLQTKGSAVSGGTVAAASPVIVPVRTPATAPGKADVSKSGHIGVAVVRTRLQDITRFFNSAKSFSIVRMAIVFGIAAVIITGIIFAVRLRRIKANPANHAAAAVTVILRLEPADASIKIDGQLQTGVIASLVSGQSYKVQVSRLGYRTKEIDMVAGPAWTLALDPEPVHLRVHGSLPDFELVRDDSTHKLSVISGLGELFSLDFETPIAGKPAVKPVTGKGVLVISNLGPSAVVYSGNPLTHVSFGGQSLPDIGSDGAQLPPMNEQTHEISFVAGRENRAISIDLSNAPMLLASLQANASKGHLYLSSSAESAELQVNRKPAKRHGKFWDITGPPGDYALVMSAGGYQAKSWTEKLEQGRTSSKKIQLQSASFAGATLVFHDGTPGAEVIVAGKKIGELDGQGTARLQAALPAGQNSIELRKDGFESAAFSREITSENSTVEINASIARLKEFGTLQLRVSPKEAKVHYRHLPDDSDSHPVNSNSVRLKAGQYQVEAEAHGYQAQKKQVSINSAQTFSLDLMLIRGTEEPSSIYAQPDAVEHVNGWDRSSKGKDIAITKGIVNTRLVFQKPTQGTFRRKKLRFWIQSASGNEKVLYEVDDQKLLRRLMVNEKSSDHKEINVQPAQGTTSYVFRIRVQGDHITVSSDGGTVLDEYSANGYDLEHGTMMLKTDDYFIVEKN
jgi:eukaryotic-like serine/threonine-protein kinase